MRHGNKVKNLTRPKSEREALIIAQTKTLLENGKLETTTPKAKIVKQFADRLLYTLVSKDGMELERALEKALKTKAMHEYMIGELKAKLPADKTGGFTRIYKVENRKGDDAPMSLLILTLNEDKNTKKSRN